MIELLSKLSLDKVIQDIRDRNQDQGMLVEAKLDEYKETAKMSTTTNLVTLSDLLKIMLTIVDPKETTTSDTFCRKRVSLEYAMTWFICTRVFFLFIRKFYRTTNKSQKQ